MNVERRLTARLCIELLHTAAETKKQELSDAAHEVLCLAVKGMRTAEEWALKNQERHAGKNASTDTSIAISRVALPALEKAVIALGDDDFHEVIDQLTLAMTTDGSTPRRRRK